MRALSCSTDKGTCHGRNSATGELDAITHPQADEKESGQVTFYVDSLPLVTLPADAFVRFGTPRQGFGEGTALAPATWSTTS